MSEEQPYQPAGGAVGRLRRLSALLLARRPMPVRLVRPVVSFTFDDFPESAARVGKDALEARGWRGTYFASACYAGTENHLGRMYDVETLRRLVRDGHEIGCHTHSHVDSARTRPGDLLLEVAQNRAALSAMLGGVELSTFAFPYGEASPRAKALLADRFQALRGARAGINREDTDRALLRAVGVDGGEPGIAKALAHAAMVAEAPGWLIYYLHDVRDDPSPWGCTPAQLRRVIDAVAATGAEVLPLRAVLERLSVRAAQPSARAA